MSNEAEDTERRSVFEGGKAIDQIFRVEPTGWNHKHEPKFKIGNDQPAMLVTLLFLPLSISITTSAMTNPLSKTKLAGADPIFAVSTAFTESSHPEKISVGVGAYRGETGEPLVMAAVTAAKGRLASQISQNWTHEYIPIGGLDLFLGGARTLLFGKSPSSAVTSIQSLSGTGALRLFADLAFQNPSFTTIAIPNPTWGNHKDIFAAAGLKTIGYTYLDPSTPKKPSIDFTKTLSSLSSLPPNTIALFHLCAHNPSGVDFSKSQWKELAELCKSNQLFPCFDNAYQGFATGDLEVSGTGGIVVEKSKTLN